MDRLTINIGASFTAHTISLFAPLWSGVLRKSIDVAIAPPAALFQQLLTPGGALRAEGPVSADTPIFILVRWSDLAGDGKATDVAVELAQAVQNAPGTHVIILCADDQREYKAADDMLRASVKHAESVDILLASDIFKTYQVHQPFDTDADSIAQTPYTMEGFAALSAAITRHALAVMRKPVKLIAVDCDNTLWRGVVGEDGSDGIAFDAGHRALQSALARQAEAGRIVVLLSKNDERDVSKLFESRADMILRREHILAMGVNWHPKAQNLTEIAARFGVGEDAILFLDDNPVEIAEMKSAMPGVVAMQTNMDRNAINQFTDHLWLLDVARSTREDQSRVQMYREEVARADEQRAAPSLQAFLDGLKLEIEIFDAKDEDIERLAQLTQRTNQFNINLERYPQSALGHWADTDGNHLFGVRVKDRFGDYGTVGVMGASQKNETLEVVLFMLSCRALGRGVEHAMAAHLGTMAATSGCASVRFGWCAGPRNEPARAFLEEVLGAPPSERRMINASTLAGLTYKPSHIAPSPVRIETMQTTSIANDADIWVRVANDMTTGAQIFSALRARTSPRPELMTAFASPSPGLEREIARIWEDVLGVAPVGSHDAFTDLGGKSIQLVQVHARLVRALNRQFDFTLLFEHASVAQLAARLSGRQSDRISTTERAQAMRAARTSHGLRLKTVREATQ